MFRFESLVSFVALQNFSNVQNLVSFVAQFQTFSLVHVLDELLFDERFDGLPSSLYGERMLCEDEVILHLLSDHLDDQVCLLTRVVPRVLDLLLEPLQSPHQVLRQQVHSVRVLSAEECVGLETKPTLLNSCHITFSSPTRTLSNMVTSLNSIVLT